MMNNLKYDIRKTDKIIIFGYSDLGKIIYKELLYDYAILKEQICFCDNSQYKQCKQPEGMVRTVEETVKLYTDGRYIIASTFHFFSMKKQLIDLGVEEKNIFAPSKEAINEKERNEKTLNNTPRKELQFEIALTEHCNLNCKGCALFSPLAKEKYVDVMSFENDFRRLAYLFNGKSGRIYLLGGEPLLSKDIVKLMCISRENFRESDISIVTNGILLKSMPEKFWEACGDNRIGIIITKYPIRINYNEIFKIAERHNVKCSFFGNGLDCKYTFHLPLDIEGKQDMKESFEKCFTGNSCITLKDGKLFTCSIAPYSYWFAEAFDVDINISKDDYIDIYKAKSSDEILKFLSKPIPFCKYCAVKNRTYDHLWELSKKEISEWT